MTCLETCEEFILCGSAGFGLAKVTASVEKFSFSSRKGGTNHIRLDQSRRIFAVAGWDHRYALHRNVLDSRTRVYHARTCKALAVLPYHQKSVSQVAFDENGEFATGSLDSKIALWNVFAQDITAPAQG